MRDVEVIITRETLPVTRAGFGLPLILSIEGAHSYKHYGSLAEVAVDFPPGSPAHTMASQVFGQESQPSKLAIFGVNYDPVTDAPVDVTAALDQLVEAHDDWYFLICTDQDDAMIAALSAWTEGRTKLYFAASDDLALAGTLSADRTVILYHTAPETHPAAAWVGRCAPEDPGSITWKFKRLSGVDPVAISSTQLEQLHDAGGNSYLTKMGRPQTSEGLVTSGEFIDVIRSQDWLSTRIAENIQDLLATSPKIPFDNRGIAQVVSRLTDALQQATAQGIIAWDSDGNALWSITAPNAEEVPADDRAQRLLPNVRFEATLAGAIHGVRVVGVLRV